MKYSIKFLLVICFIGVISFLCLSFSKVAVNKDCDDLKSEADDAYTYFRKAYNEEDLEEAQTYAKKGMNASSSAEDKAQDEKCACEDAQSAAEEAYAYGKKAYNADDLSDAQEYSKKAMDYAEEITSEAEDCEEE